MIRATLERLRLPNGAQQTVATSSQRSTFVGSRMRLLWVSSSPLSQTDAKSRSRIRDFCVNNKPNSLIQIGSPRRKYSRDNNKTKSKKINPKPYPESKMTTELYAGVECKEQWQLHFHIYKKCQQQGALVWRIENGVCTTRSLFAIYTSIVKMLGMLAFHTPVFSVVLRAVSIRHIVFSSQYRQLPIPP